MRPVFRTSTALLVTGFVLCLAPLSTSAAPSATRPSSAPPAGTPLSAGATLDELRGAAGSILGPTDDAIAEVAAFGPMPAGVPTPPGSFVDDFSVARMNDETSANGYVELIPSIPIADATDLCLTAFADARMTIGSDSTAQNDSGTLRRIDFDAVADAASPTVYAVEFLDAD